ncbi:MAG: tRNA 4-thiouridine(8) synthase ThiI [Kiritimatiellae bacterium]|nr:tRNA 4-thiouridine(8) synthase ThiI [Kiritimatiellia bacterium]
MANPLPAPDLLHAIPWDALLIHFSEIALKGGNRHRFVEALQNNIQRVLRDDPVKVSAYHDRLIVTTQQGSAAALIEKVSHIFGISAVSPVRLLPSTVDAMRTAALETYRAAPPGATFAVRAKRSNKRFPMTSSQIQFEVGGYVKEQTDATVCLGCPDVLIKFRVSDNCIYQEGPAVQGPAGLPLGVSGRVLTLFSGGIDSPVAAWMTMKRGCTTDYLHFHTYPSPEQVLHSKIYSLIRDVIAPQGRSARLILVPYHPFEEMLLGSTIPQEYELILFRRFMARTACALARKNRCAALVTGDNLGQVASQTLENLSAFDQACDLPVFRPLVMANKNDIIDLAKKISTFAASVEPYKDCCSLVARGPQTHPRLVTIQRIESTMPIAETVETAVQAATIHEVE